MHRISKICIILTAFIFCLGGLAQGAVEMQDTRTLSLGAKPIDIAISADGKYTFVLAEGGKVFVFDSTGTLSDTLKVSDSVVSIGTNASGDYLLLADSSAKSLEVVRLGFIVDIDVSGLPYKGPADAPVVMAVFSDYQ